MKVIPDVSGIAIPYDDNGNMTSHEDKGILQIDYNFLNLPDKLKFDNTHIVRSLFGGTTETRNITTKYIFRSDGSKISKLYSYGVARNQSETYKMTEYLDGFQYEMEGSSVVLPTVLKFVPTAEGYYNFENNKYIYNYTDHLGNTRLSYFNNGSGAEVLEENNYYPFGMKHDGYNPLIANQSYQYKYNGKELQTESGMYDYGARFYMPDLGRWGVVDPLAEMMRRHSPYNYAFNNPIRFIDPDGMAPAQIDPTDFNRNADKLNKKALYKFARTEQGYDILAKYAKKGDRVAGITFEKDGEFHKKGIDLKLTSEKASVALSSATTNSKIEDGRLLQTINLPNKIGSIGSGIGSMGHEFFIHAFPQGLDFSDDKKLNLSAGYFLKEKRYLLSLGYTAEKNSAYFGIFDHYQEKKTNNANNKYITPLLLEYYNKTNKNVSKETIFNSVSGFSIVSDDERVK